MHSNGDGWVLHCAYDYRFGIMGLRVEGPNVDHNFGVSVVNLFRSCNIHPDELRGFAGMLEQGVDIPNGDIEGARMKALADTDWKGKVVLDIGGYDGFAAEIAHKGGAARAICLDNRQYDHYAVGDPGKWLDVRREGVEYITGDFMDWEGEPDTKYNTDGIDGTGIISLPYERWPDDREPFKSAWYPIPDVLIFYNVLYHLRNPWAALDHLRTLVKPGGEMLLCTLFRFSERPEWYLYEARECNPNDETVYWGPSVPGLERMLKATGWTFKQEGIAMDRVVYRCQPIPNFKDVLAETGLARA